MNRITEWVDRTVPLKMITDKKQYDRLQIPISAENDKKVQANTNKTEVYRR